MRFPLTQQLLDEARAYSLRAACRDCFFWREPKGEAGEGAGAGAREGECWHGWPDEGQRSWPLARRAGEEGDEAGATEKGAAGAAAETAGEMAGQTISETSRETIKDTGERGETAVGGDVAFCKEFELR